MSRFLSQAAVMVCIVFISVSSMAQETPVLGESGIDSFSLLWERNIFSSTRQAPVREVVREEMPPPPVVDEFALVGTLVTDEHAYAFFNGSDRDYRGVRMIGGQIAGCTITQVDTEKIVIQLNEEKKEMAVGTGMKRVNQGPWSLEAVMQIVPTGDISQNVVDGSTETSTSTAVEGSAPMNDVLRKLMERRRQELQR
jgi:hypothetical protein